MGAWKQAVEVYGVALSSLEADATLGGTRERLLKVGQAVQEQPGAVRVLRERGAEFGMGEQPHLARVVASAQPERAVAELMKASEDAVRAQQRQQAAVEAERLAQEAARQQEQAHEQQARARSRSRPQQGSGPSM